LSVDPAIEAGALGELVQLGVHLLGSVRLISFRKKFYGKDGNKKSIME
jgi:hypothetical protein